MLASLIRDSSRHLQALLNHCGPVLSRRPQRPDAVVGLRVLVATDGDKLKADSSFLARYNRAMSQHVKHRQAQRRKRELPEQWRRYASTNKKSPQIWQGALAAAMLGVFIGLGSLGLGKIDLALGPMASMAPITEPAMRRQFSLCHTSGGTNCVVDGDTIWLDGEKVRIADIDAPETHPSRCQREAELGNRATLRLQELLNSGPFTAIANAGRERDKFDRKLMVLARDGHSLGEMLVQEGLARIWDGRRHPWC